VSLLGQQFHELATGRPEGLAGFAEQFGNVAPRNLDANDILEKVSNSTVRGVDSALEVSDQAGQAWPEQTRLDDVLGQRCLVITAAVMAPNALSGVLENLERFFHELDLLHGALVFRSLNRSNSVGGIDRTLLQAKRDPLIDWIGSKSRPLMLGMPLLAANPALGLSFSPLPLGLHNVTGRRF